APTFRYSADRARFRHLRVHDRNCTPSRPRADAIPATCATAPPGSPAELLPPTMPSVATSSMATLARRDLPAGANQPAVWPMHSTRRSHQFENPQACLLDRVLARLAAGQYRTDARRAAVFAGTCADQSQRLLAQLLAPLEQRQRQSHAAGVVVIEEQRWRERARGIEQRFATFAGPDLAASTHVRGREPCAIAAAHRLLQVAAFGH